MKRLGARAATLTPSLTTPSRQGPAMADPTIRREVFPPGKPQASPNMFIRVVTGIRSHFAERVLEWVMAANIVWWGMRLTDPAVQWSNAEAWAFMLSWGISEEGWGWICVFIGALRLLALIINGTFADTWYSTVSPWVRGMTAGAGAIVWFMVFLSVSAANTSGAGIYQLPLVLDTWCSLHVLFTIGRASRGTARNVGLS